MTDSIQPPASSLDEEDLTNDPLVGQTVAERFRVVRPLARGGMGTVYHAVQVHLERDVALKVLHSDLASLAARRDARRRFLNEAAATARLCHPNTVVIHDYGELGDDGCYIAMELLAGHTLRELIDERPMEPDRVVHIGIQVAGSLAEAHEAGLIHRDVKPGNVMLSRRGADPDFAKVLDFGLVKVQREDADLSDSNAMVGTPRYMAPEQVFVDDVSPATDVYGLGATLYHALRGRPPFDSESRYILMAAHVSTEPPPLREVMPPGRTVPDALADVIMRCLRKHPSERFASMADLAEALQLARAQPAVASVPLASLPPPSGAGSSDSSSGLRRTTPRRTDPATDTTIAFPDEEQNARSEAGRPAAWHPAPWHLGVAGVLAGGAILAAVLLLSEQGPRAGAPPPPGPVAEEAAPARPPRPEPVLAAGRPRVVTLVSEPAGARVRRGDEDLGDTPLSLEVPADARWELTVTADGYLGRVLTVTPAQREVRVRLRRRGGREGGRAAPTPAADREAPAEAAPSPAESRPRRRTDNRDPWADE
ncbi:MAG: serine/threonine-protein kinase [Sandaracinaceae bacterium]